MIKPVKHVSTSKSRQQGATLLTVMIFLVLMTIVTISASQISIMDILISGNDQQRVVAYQTAENNMTEFATTSSWYKAFASGGFDNDKQQYKTSDSTNELSRIITDLLETYPCERQGSGSSLGGGTPPCKLYDFKILLNQKNTGARENHRRGAGKMIPNPGSKFSIL